MSDYLWDKAGEPDAEVERLETLLSNLRHTPRPLALPSEVASDVSPRRALGWRRFLPARLRFVPARLFEPVWLGAAVALLLTFLLGAGALMRGRVFVDEGGAVSHEARPTQTQTPSTQASSSQAPTPERRESELTNARAKVGGGAPFVQEVTRKRAESVALVKPRQRATATTPAVQTIARTGEAVTLEAMSARGRAGATSLIDGTRLMAKEQLIYALRLTGAKLKEVESKAHGAGEQKTAARGGVR